jgi:hypothetical protein
MAKKKTAKGKTAKSKAKGRAENRGDPTVVSLRVRDIDRIVQLRGLFERFPVDYERLLPTLAAPEIVGEVIDKDQISVVGDFVLEGRASTHGGTEEPGPVVVRIEARFAAFYRIDEGPEFPAESLESFAFLNGQLNIWPYWREYVQDCLARAGFSVLTLPPFNPVRMSRAATERESQDRSTGELEAREREAADGSRA